LKEKLVLRDKVFLAIRNIVSLAPKVGLVKKPNYHKNGVTFLVAVKDEERWIKQCIQSIQAVADEIIIVDSSVEDKTTKIVESLVADNPKIKHIKFYFESYNAIALALHIGLVNASYKWVFKWDSDLVAKSSEALQEWIDRLKRLPNRYYAIVTLRVNFKGDLEHLSRSEPFGGCSARIFTWSPQLRGAIKGDCEQVIGDSIWGEGRLPPYYKILRWTEPYIFHCDIKNHKRLFVRSYWEDWMLHREKRFKDLEEYASYRIQQDEGINLEEGVRRFSEQLIKDTIPYDKARFGELPDLLKNI
jgi:glycosyltransferase involved in cell wall biosynthesis